MPSTFVRDVVRIFKERGLLALIGSGLKDVARALDTESIGIVTGRGWRTDARESHERYGMWAAHLSVLKNVANTLDPAYMLVTRASPAGRRLDRAQAYPRWVEQYDRPTTQDFAAMRRRIDGFARRPLLSVVMPVYDPDPRFLRRALDTILAQVYPDWQLCIADDASKNEAVRDVLRDYAARDARIQVTFRSENGHISRASNSALELVRGEFVALMDHDDELPPHALYMIAEEILRHPDVDLIYTDEDKIDQNGKRFDPHFKTDWNEDLFTSQNMVAHLGVFRTTSVRAVGGFREGFEGSQDYDFVLRFLKTTRAERIRHIPFVLYHWRIFRGVRTFSSDNPDRSVETAGRALREWIAETVPGGVLEPMAAFPSWWRLRRPIPSPEPLVSVIVPTRDRADLLRNLFRGLLGETAYANFEVIVVDNGSVEPETAALFAEVSQDARVRVLRDDAPFNYSRINNRAVGEARGTLLCFLNNDIETVEPGWLGEMVAHACRPDVGAVGARLLYGEGPIQHAGVVLGIYGVAAHGHRHFPANGIGYFGHPQLLRRVSAVTGAALVMRRDVFDAVGGFDEVNLAVSYNDVDLCLKVREAGYGVVYTPFAVLKHLESATRGPDETPAKRELQRIERGYMRARWGDLLDHDPFYSPNLSLDDEDYRLAFPPRVEKPWLAAETDVDRFAREGLARLPSVDPRRIAEIAAATTLVLAGPRAWDTLTALGRADRRVETVPRHVLVVDNTPLRDGFVGRGVIRRLASERPDLSIDVLRDPALEINPSRGADLGLARVETEWVAVATSDGIFARGWLDGLIAARSATAGDGFVAAVAPTGTSPGEPGPRTGLVFGRHDAFRRATPIGARGPYDETLLADDARLEDFRLTCAAAEIPHVATDASAVAPFAEETRPPLDRWRIEREAAVIAARRAGRRDEDATIEFVCPFHRGDVLIGLQCANTAWRMGKRLRFHVAEELRDWIAAFETPFPIETIPVAVPKAEGTRQAILQACEHVLARPDTSLRIALSHPTRGLDEMDVALVDAMLAALGVPAGTPLVELRPRPSPEQREDVARALADHDGDFVVIHRSGGWALKTLPDPIMDRLVELVRAEGLRAIQIGGPGDAHFTTCDGWITEAWSVGHWTALFERTRCVVGVDSWSSHLAAILDVPQITLYGSTRATHVASRPKFADRRSPALCLETRAECSPCNSFVCRVSPASHCAGYGFDHIDVIAMQAIMSAKSR